MINYKNFSIETLSDTLTYSSKKKKILVNIKEFSPNDLVTLD